MQEQYKDKGHSVMQGEIVDKGREYFYSTPSKNCKIDDLFLIPQDKFDILSTYGDFSFIA